MSRTMGSPAASTGQFALSCFQIDPLRDDRWGELVDRHRKASVFHTVPWLQALHDTYGYESVVFTTTPIGEELKDGIVLCRVNSRVTGQRFVSLPFSDHCEPLYESKAECESLIRGVQSALQTEGLKYLEFRPVAEDSDVIAQSTQCAAVESYFWHRLNLGPSLADIFQSLDRDSVQRRIQRADRAGLIEECGRTENLLAKFYSLFTATRRRQGVPPSPHAWFRNLICRLKDALQIRVAHKDEIPVAAIVTLRFRDIVYYKYGCSDERFNSLGATPWLFWNAITAAKSDGAVELDLGRTEESNLGLLNFKNHWVPRPQRLTYWRYPACPPLVAAGNWKMQLAKTAFSFMPTKLLTVIGQIVYRHIG